MFDEEGVRVTFPRGCRSEIDPVIIFHSFRMMFISRESSQGFLEGSRRMFCNKLILSIDSPRSVEELPEFNLGLRIGSFWRPGGRSRIKPPSRTVLSLPTVA